MVNMDRQEKIIIYLHADDLAHPSWAIVDVDNQVRQTALHDTADGIAAIAEEKMIVVIVPGEDVVLASVQLPKMNKTKLLQALPFALEEQLVGELSELHFAISDIDVDGTVHAAIVAHSKMQEWLALLQSWNIKPDMFTPAMLALPSDALNWHVAIDDIALVRVDQYQGYAVDVPNLSALLDTAFTSQEKVPQEIIVRHYRENGAMPALDLPVTIKNENFSKIPFIHDLAYYVTRTPEINLLQSVYAVKKSVFPQMNKLWKAASYLLAAWIILLFIYPTMSYFILHSRLSAINSAIDNIYKSNFPQAKSIVAPKTRMAEKLQKLSAQVGENRLLLLLGYVGKGMSLTPNIKLKRFDFQNNQLTLELTAQSPEDFSAFTDYLTQQGLNTKQQNATLSDSRINATLVIE